MEAGLLPGDFWNLCFEETLLLIKGYEDRVNVQWQQTRLIVYTIGATVTPKEKRGEVYDMFYIPGDPTPEQRMQKVMKEQELAATRAKEFNDELRREMAAGKKKK